MQNKFEERVEGDIIKTIHNYGISVDKDELVKALDYDRQQYEGETEYDEMNDCYWVTPCWYEINAVDNNPNWEIDDDYVVTHWMPLPVPPEVEK